MEYTVNDPLQYHWVNSFGDYYTWPLADTICPAGTHLPSKTEWETLIQFAGGDTTALRKLKHSTAYWMDKDYAYYLGTDDYGFGAVGAGRKKVGDGSTVIKGSAYYWTSTTEGDSVYTLYLHKNDQLEFIKVHKTSYVQSVRCLK